MTVKTSGSLELDRISIGHETISKPQRAWRDKVETYLKDFTETYFHKAFGNTYMVSNADTTGINAVDDWIMISGSYVGDDTNSYFTSSASGSLRYTGTIPKDCIVYSTMFKRATSGTPAAGQRIYLNNAPISSSKMTTELIATLGESSVLIDKVRITENDVIDIRVANLEDTTDIVVETHHFLIHSIN